MGVAGPEFQFRYHSGVQWGTRGTEGVVPEGVRGSICEVCRSTETADGEGWRSGELFVS